ncbi:hypothetical protein H6F67_18840 [Microcoleus sp. FACHB-1515]|uniref:hypothetical protein n=1 Tax=Cyanophyceae TaxID=3028117 RepID=UPI00168999F1|nr:hypothetical protein [Microcoleus sp. FACHB-1515]MBD2091905.1 hypothetical protein [Microcoleus sp. FACHB-1515]
MFAQSRRFTPLQTSSLSSNRSRFWWFHDRNDSIDDSINIGKLNKSFKYDDDGQVRDDESVFYRFKIKNSGSVKFNFKNEGEESITFSIVNSQNRLIVADGRRLFREVDEDEKGKLKADLDRGTYYLRITTDGDREDYSIKLKFRSNRDDD